MRTRSFKVVALVLLAAFAMARSSHAQNMTVLQLTPDGATSLTSLPPGSIPSDDLRVKPGGDFLVKPGNMTDTGIPRQNGPSVVLSVPGPSPQGFSAPDSSLVGFNGISHLDQRLAGTLAYANTQFSTEPPDQGLAAGNGFVVEAVNDALAVYDQRTRAPLVGPTPLNQFFRRSPEIVRGTHPVYGDFLSDPRVLFDHDTERWFVTVLEIDTDPATGSFANTRSRVLIAVSQTDDPSKKWNLLSLDVTANGSNGTQAHPGCPCFGDQPLIGADKNGFYISTNEFGIISPAVNGAQIYAMDKESLADGLLPAVVHISSIPFPEGFPFSIQPAFSPSARNNDDGDSSRNKDAGSGKGVEYFMSVPFVTILDNRIVVWALSNTMSLKHSNPSLKLTHLVLQSEGYGIPNDAKQKVGPTPLGTLLGQPEELVATNDFRMQQVVHADGKLWSAITTSVSQGPNCVDGFESDCKTGIAWFIVEPSFEDGKLSAKIDRQGYLSVQGNNLFYPSIGVNDDGRGIIAFALSGANYFPSSAYARIDRHGVGSIRIAAAGVAPEDGFSGYPQYGGAGSGRWGDYTAAVADGNTIWFATEYIPAGSRTTLANWGTFIGHVTVAENEDGNEQ